MDNDEDKVIQLLRYGKCSCSNPAEDDHTCPYSEEINDDYISLCNCCVECQRICADDI